jgi:VIT1/CCC1 family predicted Fe2+/Mn2+ transporter
MTDPKDIEIEEDLIASKEFVRNTMAAKLNWLRAGVLGANDGIMSTSGMVLGVAASAPATVAGSMQILVAGVAAVVAGSISMAGGEYTSVSAQKDSEKAALEVERRELADSPEAELLELTWYYEQKGMSRETASLVAKELTAKDALKAHAEAELGIDSEHHVSPAAAAISSFVAFAVGGLLPLLAMVATPRSYGVPATVIAVVLSLTLTGYVGAKIGGARPSRGILRNLVVSLLTMGVTYAIGHLVGSQL